MNRKAKDNLYAAAPLVEGFNLVVGEFEASNGAKSACQEVALLAFLRMSRDEILAAMDELRRAEMAGKTRNLAEAAIGKPIPASSRFKMAAKHSKPSRKPSKTDRQT